MNYIQLWSEIGQRWVNSTRAGLTGAMEFGVARAQVKTLQAAKWQIVNRNMRVVAHGNAGD